MSRESSKNQDGATVWSQIPGRVFNRNDITMQRIAVPLCSLWHCLLQPSCGVNPSVCGQVTGSRYTWETNLGLSVRLYEDEVNQAGRRLTSNTLNVGGTVPQAGVRNRTRRRKSAGRTSLALCSWLPMQWDWLLPAPAAMTSLAWRANSTLSKTNLPFFKLLL